MNSIINKKIEDPLFQTVLTIMSDISDLRRINALLGWDQETYMPDGSWEARAKQSQTLEILEHKLFINDDTKKLVDKIKNNKAERSSHHQRMLEIFVKDYEKNAKIPTSFVENYSIAKSKANESWKKARKKGEFNLFEKDLDNLIELTIQKTNHLGYEKNPYNALLNEYEEGANYDSISEIFSNLKTETIRLSKKYISKENFQLPNADKFNLSKKKQLKLCKEIAKALCFDFFNGRLDESHHPFTTSFSKYDVRITTRFDTKDIFNALYSTIHEVGHGLYEQGIDNSLYNTFAEEGTSLGIHESQSLIWENNICRSLEFWVWAMPLLRKYFPSEFSEVSEMEMYKVCNQVSYSFIRTESDELTYNLHIILRFEIENELINRKLKTKDIPERWNELFKEMTGLTIENNNNGCLQDIHWSFGGFGYFPTYSLGKLYAASLMKQMEIEFDVWQNVKNGEFMTLRTWLRNNIHQWGRLKTPKQIIQNVANKNLNSIDFVSYLEDKLDKIYS